MKKWFGKLLGKPMDGSSILLERLDKTPDRPDTLVRRTQFANHRRRVLDYVIGGKGRELSLDVLTTL